MSILNRANDGLLSLLIALYRCLLSEGPMSRARLFALCAPPAIRERQSTDPLGTTLRQWTKLGFFVQRGAGDDVQIALAPPFDGTAVSPDGEFRRHLRALVMSEVNNPDLEGRALAGDFTRAIAWLLAQDVYALPAGEKGILELDRLHFQNTVSPFENNPANWPAFPDWVPFLGFGWISKPRDGLTIDPTTAVADELDHVFTDGVRELSIDGFIQGLAQAIPVLDAGTHRRAVEAQLRGWRGPSPSQISISLSRALVRLRYAEVLRLERRGDAGRMMQILGRQGRVLEDVSHVVRLGDDR
jgi:hypothetical protein